MKPSVRQIWERRQELRRELWQELWREEGGQDLVEYGLLVVLVALGAILGMQALASAINTTFSTAGSDLTNTT